MTNGNDTRELKFKAEEARSSRDQTPLTFRVRRVNRNGATEAAQPVLRPPGGGLVDPGPASVSGGCRPEVTLLSGHEAVT